MNLPNKITVFRVILIPVFTVLLLVEGIPYGETAALVVFCIACISDFIDGYLARKNNQVTDFGKFLDPLADKLLVCTALICFIEVRDNFPCWIAILIIAREFIISAFRVVAADNGIVISAGYLGKIKTVLQMFTCIAFLLNFDYEWFNVAENCLMYAAAVMTVISVADYIYRNRTILTHSSK